MASPIYLEYPGGSFLHFADDLERNGISSEGFLDEWKVGWRDG